MDNSKKETGTKMEKEFKSRRELIHVQVQDYERSELEKANRPIRMRNLVRKRMSELEKKALEFFSVPSGSMEVAEKLYEYLSKTEKFSLEDEYAMRDALMTLIIYPMNESRKIVDAKIMRKVHSDSGSYFVLLLQDATLVTDTDKPLIFESE
ncbi:MAG: hypothetical protein WC788_02110 [Candidatus Paceibacterota bacterium]